MSFPVKFFHSSMQGAPQITNDWGVVTGLLDACLVTGFNTRSVSALSCSSGVATATVASGHLYEVGQILVVSGADQPEFNGEVKVLGVTSTTFSFAVSGSPVSPATGSVSVKVAPLGWELAFSGTNKRAYRSKSVLSHRPFLRVDDGLDPVWTTTWAKFAKVTMAESMSDIDTFVGARAPFDPVMPNKNELGSGSGNGAYNGWFKWMFACQDSGSGYIYNSYQMAPDVGARNWVLVGDDRGFYFLPQMDVESTSGRAVYAFTDFDSFRVSDIYDAILVAKDEYWPAYFSSPTKYNQDTSCHFGLALNFEGKVLMRDHTLVGYPVRAAFTTLNTNNGQLRSGFSTGIPWPNPSDYGLLLHPSYIVQEGSNMGLRGKMPGVFWVLNHQPLSHLAKVSGVAGLPGREFLMTMSAMDEYGNSTVLAFDVTGPWR